MPLPEATLSECTDNKLPADRSESRREITVGIHTLGCRLNQYESDGILNGFQKRRYRIVPLSENPDVAIVNTCTVTEQADARNRNIIRSILRKNPRARVFVTGCYAQTDARRILAIEGVSGVIGNDGKASLFDIIEAHLESEEQAARHDPDEGTSRRAVFAQSGGAIVTGSSGKRPPLPDPFAFGDVFPVDHSRAYLKIQDGCDRLCTYCKVPQARGGGISRSRSEIIEHARNMDEAGIPEIVLTGVNLGWYREAGYRLPDLLEDLLGVLKHARLRLSSIEPSDVGERLAAISVHPAFCNYLHIPLQSGSANILRRMKRTYTPATFLRRIDRLRSVNPDIFLGTDVMVGFPGESEEDFEATLSVLRSAEVAGIHAFPFSPREGTSAAGLPGRLHGSLIRSRMERLATLKEQSVENFYRRMQGRRVAGVVEGQSEGRLEVLTGEYLRLTVEDPGGGVRKGHILEVVVQAEGHRGILTNAIKAIP